MQEISRHTKETRIDLSLDLGRSEPAQVETNLPFLGHMLTAMATHGGFSVRVAAHGDVEVDPHHLIEDCGIVLGQALRAHQLQSAGIARFGHAVIPMDEALAEVSIDVCGRSTFVYRPVSPEQLIGTLSAGVFREFWAGLADGARISVHCVERHGENAHHAVEAGFKALGKAIAAAYAPVPGRQTASTKGRIE